MIIEFLNLPHTSKLRCLGSIPQIGGFFQNMESFLRDMGKFFKEIELSFFGLKISDRRINLSHMLRSLD